MGAESSVQRDGKSQEDASASASAGEVDVLQEASSVLDSKPLQKNGQISSLSSLNGHSEDNTLAEVGQPDGVSVAQKEEAPETMDVQDEVTPQVNGEKVEKESPDANDISAVEEKAAEEKPEDANEVGFKKIFRFVGFKFTLKKDKSEEKDPVKLLTVKDKEGEEVTGTDEATKEEEAATAEEKSPAEDEEADKETASAEAEVTKDDDKAEAADAPAEGAAEPTEDAVKEEGAEKESEASPPAQETTLSPFRKLFSGGLFSNLRKKTSVKKTKEEEEKEAAVEEEAAKTEETAAAAAVEEKEEKEEVEKETKEEAPGTPEEEKSEPKEETPASPVEAKSETVPEPEISAKTPVPASTTDETKQEEEKAEPSAEEETAPAEVTTEAELLSSQEKTKPQGSPLKKLFTGAGLKKLSTKKQKAKKDAETKPTESGEQAAEQLQSSTESTEAPKAESGPSSPEESGEHVLAVEVTQIESSQETEGEVTSDGEKKKEGIIAWSSFKKLVTPKKRVKRSSESDDEATGEKPAKSATLSSSESAPLADKSVEEEAKEEKPAEEEPKTETTEKLVSSTEEPKKKMDTSVSWEALMCMGGPKKRTRKTSDSDDEETKIEEEIPAAAAVEGEQEGKTEAAVVTSQSTEHEGEVVSSPEPLSSPPERESAWDTLKRMVMLKNRTKSEDKTEEGGEQVLSDTEAPKDESTFSLRKFLPGRRKKKAEKQASTEHGTGDEDSDTPAVVPLSEYEESEQEVPAEPEPEPALVQSKVSAEDRSPSWIPAMVEHIEDKRDELSDIPEEAENAATPKSVDTDITEDDTEDDAAFAAKAKALSGRRLSTAEVKPIDQVPSAETTPVPQGPTPESAKEVLECIQAHVSEIPTTTSVAVEDVPVEEASVKTEFEPPTETAEAKSNTVLEPHACGEAVAICTGLGTEEIAEVALEEPAEPIVETVAVIRDALSTEVSQEEKQPCVEEATVTEDVVLKAQVHQVETTELEPAVETLVCGVTDVQAADESIEPEIEKVGVISTAVEGSEMVQSASVSENSPKTVVVSAITPTSETAICTESVAVTELTIETKEVKIEDTEINVPEEVQKVTEEMTVEASKVTEPEVLEVPSEEAPVITETVVLSTSTIVEAEQVKISEPVGEEPVQVQKIEEEKTVEAATVPAAESEISAAVEEVNETIEEIKDGVPKDSEIEAQSKVIAEAVIQDAMDKVTEDTAKPKKATTPTTTMPAMVQAIATTEKEIEISSEGPVITDTPVPLVCEKPATKSPQTLHVAMEVINTIPVEVVDSIDAPGDEEMKPEELKKAVEVIVSEETVVVEEVVEIKAESQTGEELEQVREEQSKEDTEVQEPAEVVKPEAEEAEVEAPTVEKKKEKVLEIHTPVQVVLQTAQVMEEPSVEEEVVVEFDSNGPATEESSVEPERPALENKLSTLSEDPAEATSEEDSAPSQIAEAAASQPETEKTPSTSVKCAEVMAQVIEVIEEAVKEIEPVSTEITAAS